jgi:hypothetical protein
MSEPAFDRMTVRPERTEQHVGRLNRRMPRILLLCALGFLALGAVSIALGVHADAINWWANHPYLANLFASLTSALFGIPFALLFVSFLYRRLAQHVAEENLRQRIQSLIAELDEITNEWVEESLAAACLDSAVYVRDCISQLGPGSEHERDSIRRFRKLWLDLVWHEQLRGALDPQKRTPNWQLARTVWRDLSMSLKQLSDFGLRTSNRTELVRIEHALECLAAIDVRPVDEDWSVIYQDHKRLDLIYDYSVNVLALSQPLRKLVHDLSSM